MYSLPSTKNAKKVVLDETVVSGENQPYVIYESDEAQIALEQQQSRATGSD